MEKYSFKVDGLYNGLTADDAVGELNRIRDIYGELTPEHIVEESKDKNSVLHQVFEWNNSRAADKYRIQQAKDLIRNISVEIVHEEVKVSLRAFVNVQRKKDAPRELIPLIEAIKDEHAYADLLEQAKKEMVTFISIYSQISELNEVKATMLKTLNELK